MITQSNVTVMVKDLSRAIAFYTDALGLTLKARYGDGFAEIQAPGLTIGLHPSREQDTGAPRGTALSIGFGVAELEPAIALFKERGVTFVSDTPTPGPQRIVHFADPDGTPLYLIQV